jgi:hypothetical protein
MSALTKERDTPMNIRASALVTAVIGFTILSPAARAESLGCSNGVCLSFGTSNKTMNLHMTSQGGATHFNLRNSCAGGQVEVNAAGQYSITLGITSPARCSISIQACNRGGNIGPIQGRSACGQWANWNVANPANDVVGGSKKCINGFCAEITNHRSHNITIRLTSWPSSTHRNLRATNGYQVEGDQGTFAGDSVSVQACNRGFLGKSSCTAWVSFN